MSLFNNTVNGRFKLEWENNTVEVMEWYLMIYLDTPKGKNKKEENYSACADLEFAFFNLSVAFFALSVNVLKCVLKLLQVRLVKYLIFKKKIK